MTEPVDPVLPEGLNQLFEASRSNGPSADQLARLRASLELDPPAPAVPVKAVWLAAAGLAVGFVFMFGVWLISDVEPPAPIASPPTGTGALVQEAEPASHDEGAAAPESQPEAVSTVETEPGAQAPPEARPTAARALPTEVELLDRAQQALGTAPRTTLRLTRRHEMLYPGGVLTQEREFLAISAQLQLGRRTRVERRLRSFEERWPGSPHLRRLRALFEASVGSIE